MLLDEGPIRLNFEPFYFGESDEINVHLPLSAKNALELARALVLFASYVTNRCKKTTKRIKNDDIEICVSAGPMKELLTTIDDLKEVTE